MRIRKEVVLCLMLLTAFVCLRFPFPLTLFSNTTKQHTLERNWSGYFTVDGQQIYCKRYRPQEENVSGVTVILLHGASFSSQTWKEIGTLSHLADQGILAFALDLPGYGNSEKARTSNKAAFLKKVVDGIEGDVKVIVSPSVSGQYSIPYINEYGEEIDGYVPVAPVGTDRLAPSDDVREKLSVFAVAGEKDTQGVKRSSIFKQHFANFDQLIISKGEHPAYLTDPDLFNTRLSAFALSLKTTSEAV